MWGQKCSKKTLAERNVKRLKKKAEVSTKTVNYNYKVKFLAKKQKKITQPVSTKKNHATSWSSMFPNGPKWSKKIDHEFNRMAFITRFNLGFVWSKIVQILTKKLSKCVRHNQVSWSSLRCLSPLPCAS